MISPTRILAPSMLLVIAAGCGSKTPTPAPEPSAAAAGTATPGQAAAPVGATSSDPAVIRGVVAPAAARRDRQTLTRTEIRETQYTNAYDVVLALRGNWLRARTAESVNGKSSVVQVYLDMQRLPGVEELRLMSPTNIESIRFLDPLAASARFGMDHGAGAILVTTAKKM
jgi:hypothetical protein